MKKSIIGAWLLCALSIQSIAQTQTAVVAHKFLDNWYVGLNAGATTAQTGWSSFALMTPTEGLRLGKNFTSVFGIVADLELYTNFKSNHMSDTKCFVDATNLSLLGSCNLSNAIGRYKGTPRTFEFFLLGGLGWGHPYGVNADKNYVTGKAAIDAAWNFGSDKEWQLYIEPAITWAFEGYNRVAKNTTNLNYAWAFDSHHAQLCAKIGVNYKFKCSNGHHNFTRVAVTSPEEIDKMNATINSMQQQLLDKKQSLADADEKIAYLEKQLSDCRASKIATNKTEGRRIVTNLNEVVAFEFGSAQVQKSEEPNIVKVAAYMVNNPKSHVTLYGYTSPEGTPEVNSRLSQQRADVVRDLLIYKYGIAADRLTSIGLGVSDKLAVEPAAKRVVVFTDTTK